MDFFDRLKERVKIHNTTIEGFLSDVFGSEITRSTYNTWRRRRTLPRADIAVRMADKLGVSVEYLVTGSKSKDPWLDEHADFIHDCRSLDAEQLRTIEVQVHALAEHNRLKKSISRTAEGA